MKSSHVYTASVYTRHASLSWGFWCPLTLTLWTETRHTGLLLLEERSHQCRFYGFLPSYSRNRQTEKRMLRRTGKNWHTAQSHNGQINRYRLVQLSTNICKWYLHTVPVQSTYLTLPYLRGGQVVRPARPSAEAVSVRPNAQPRCNQKVTVIGCEAEASAVKPNKSPATWDWWRVVWLIGCSYQAVCTWLAPLLQIK